MWTSDIALAYFLTGDGRLKEVLRETGEYLLKYSRKKKLQDIVDRDGGWHLIGLCANYEVFGDERYLKEGRHLTEGLRYWIDHGATLLLPPRAPAFAPVHLFIALTGVLDYWRLTGDELAQETLLIGGEMALQHGLNDLGFFMTVDGQSYRLPGRWVCGHSLPVMNVLYEITGDQKWIELGMRHTKLMMAILEADAKWQLEENWAQGGIYFAYAFSFFETARKLGLLKDIR